MDETTAPTDSEEYATRLAQERRYADQMALYTHSIGVRNSWSSRPLAGPGRGSLFVWNPKDEGPFPVIDPSHPENRYGTLGVDRCLAGSAKIQP